MFPVSKSVQPACRRRRSLPHHSAPAVALAQTQIFKSWSVLTPPYRIPRKNWRTDRYSAAVNWTGLVVVPCSAVSHGHSKHSFMRLTSITTWTLISKSSDFGIIYGPSTVITRPVIVPRFPTTPPREHFLPVLWLYKKYTQKISVYLLAALDRSQERPSEWVTSNINSPCLCILFVSFFHKAPRSLGLTETLVKYNSFSIVFFIRIMTTGRQQPMISSERADRLTRTQDIHDHKPATRNINLLLKGGQWLLLLLSKSRLNGFLGPLSLLLSAKESLSEQWSGDGLCCCCLPAEGVSSSGRKVRLRGI